MASVELEWSGLPQVNALFDQFHGGPLNNRMRRALRAGLKPIREEMRREGSSRSDLPRTFAKTRTRAHRNPTAVSVSPVSPLSSIFEHGAGQHVIPGPLLAGKAGERSRPRAFVARGAVSHPGMGARPFIAPVFDASKDAAEAEFSRTLFDGLPT